MKVRWIVRWPFRDRRPCPTVGVIDRVNGRPCTTGVDNDEAMLFATKEEAQEIVNRMPRYYIGRMGMCAYVKPRRVP